MANGTPAVSRKDSPAPARAPDQPLPESQGQPVFRHASVEKKPPGASRSPPTRSNTPSAHKGPRNGPGPRGAENLNRFRERLVGVELLAVNSLQAACFRASAGGERGSSLSITPWPSGGADSRDRFLAGQGRSRRFRAGKIRSLIRPFPAGCRPGGGGPGEGRRRAASGRIIVARKPTPGSAAGSVP
jgi:hypothetical protein